MARRLLINMQIVGGRAKFSLRIPLVRHRVLSVSLRGSSTVFFLSRAKFIDGYHRSSVFLFIPRIELSASSRIRYQIPIVPF